MLSDGGVVVECPLDEGAEDGDEAFAERCEGVFDSRRDFSV